MKVTRTRHSIAKADQVRSTAGTSSTRRTLTGGASLSSTRTQKKEEERRLKEAERLRAIEQKEKARGQLRASPALCPMPAFAAATELTCALPLLCLAAEEADCASGEGAGAAGEDAAEGGEEAVRGCGVGCWCGGHLCPPGRSLVLPTVQPGCHGSPPACLLSLLSLSPPRPSLLSLARVCPWRSEKEVLKALQAQEKREMRLRQREAGVTGPRDDADIEWDALLADYRAKHG